MSLSVKSRFAFPWVAGAALLAPFMLPAGSATARTWYVLPDGSGDVPTIQAGIDSAAAGDIVLLGCGTYDEAGIRMKSGVTLRSETGHPSCAVIRPGSAIGIFCEDVDFSASIEGITIAEAVYGCPIGCQGAALVCYNSFLEISDCWFHSNKAITGAGVYCSASSPTITRCMFWDNEAHGWHWNGCGGAITCLSSSPQITGCTFVGNSAQGGMFGNGYGGAVYCLQSSPLLTNCILSGNVADLGGAYYCESACGAVLACCDIYCNQNGNWAYGIGSQSGINGNFSECPLFCDFPNRDLHLQECSPCAPGNHPAGCDCGLIGALGTACLCGEPTSVEQTSWSSLKMRYRPAQQDSL